MEDLKSIMPDEIDVYMLENGKLGFGEKPPLGDWLYSSRYVRKTRAPQPAVDMDMRCVRCNRTATYELKPDNVPAASFEPYCYDCMCAEYQACQAVAQHELDNFGGAYGVPSLTSRPIAARTMIPAQGDAKEWISAKPADDYQGLRKQFSALKNMINSMGEQLSFYQKQSYETGAKHLADLQASLDSERAMNAKLTEELSTPHAPDLDKIAEGLKSIVEITEWPDGLSNSTVHWIAKNTLAALELIKQARG